jgi:predicted ATPase
MNTVPESPYNFGFGVSYVLPIIVNGLAAEPGSTMIVENPEAHLHPKGQSRIGQFLSQVAVSGVQVVVETHSEHVVNGIRVNSLRSKLSPDDICLNYFTPDPDPAKHVRQIELNDRMDITDWPEGFFDQEEIDLRELRDIRKGL